MASKYETYGDGKIGSESFVAANTLDLEERRAAQYETLSVAILMPRFVLNPPIYAATETVPWLTCSYGVSGDSDFAATVGRRNTFDVNGDTLQCRNQIDKPAKRHHCALCGGYFCAIHAEPAYHDCSALTVCA
jgi:hypothetical protein